MNKATAARAAARHRLVALKAADPVRFVAVRSGTEPMAVAPELAGLNDVTRVALLEFVDAEPSDDGGPVSRDDGTFNYIAEAWRARGRHSGGVPPGAACGSTRRRTG